MYRCSQDHGWQPVPLSTYCCILRGCTCVRRKLLTKNVCFSGRNEEGFNIFKNAAVVVYALRVKYVLSGIVTVYQAGTPGAWVLSRFEDRGQPPFLNELDPGNVGPVGMFGPSAASDAVAPHGGAHAAFAAGAAAAAAAAAVACGLTTRTTTAARGRRRRPAPARTPSPSSRCGCARNNNDRGVDDWCTSTTGGGHTTTLPDAVYDVAAAAATVVDRDTVVLLPVSPLLRRCVLVRGRFSGGSANACTRKSVVATHTAARTSCVSVRSFCSLTVLLARAPHAHHSHTHTHT